MKRVPELRDNDQPADARSLPPRPGDDMDDAADPDQSFVGLHPADIFRQMLAMCLPPNKSYGGSRRLRAGYNRMITLSWVVAPEQFLGMTAEEVAAELKITPRAFRKNVAAVAAQLAGRPSVPRRRGP